MRAPKLTFLAVLGLVTLAKAGAVHERANPVDSCTQTDWDKLNLCLDSALSVFSVTYQNGDTSSFDYAGIASQINSLQSGLTSLGVTLTSFLPDLSSFARTAQPGSTYAGPYVSDIVSSYSEYTATRTYDSSGSGSGSGSVFSFETSKFTPEPTTSLDSPTPTPTPSSVSVEQTPAPPSSAAGGGIITSTIRSTTTAAGTITSSARLTSINTVRSTSSNSGQPALATPPSGATSGGTKETHNTGLVAALLATVWLSITILWSL